ncbi:ankyrin repeat domain-containing protein [Thermoleptolyngbya sp.]
MNLLRVASWVILVPLWIAIALLFWSMTRLQAIAWLSLLPDGLARLALMIYGNTPLSLALILLGVGGLCLWLCIRRIVPLWLMPLPPLLFLGLALAYGRIDTQGTTAFVTDAARQGNVVQTREQVLIHMARFGLPRETRALLNAGTNPNATDPDGKSALSYAVDPKIIQALLEAGAESDTSALEAAAFWGDRQRFEALLSATPDDGRALVAEIGDNALLAAAGTGTQSSSDGDRAAIVQLLLDRGADPNAKTSDGTTALAKATQMGYSQVAAVLRKAGATP